MSTIDMPTMVASNYTSQAYNPFAKKLIPNAMDISEEARKVLCGLQNQNPAKFQSTIKKDPEPMIRIVRVVIADNNPNLPVESAILYKGEEQVTELTDQELYFEINIKELLDKHNEKRVKTVNKLVKDRTEYLEPAKIRDLKMVVVTIASF